MDEQDNIIKDAFEKGLIDELDIITIHDLLGLSDCRMQNEIAILLTAMFATMNAGDLCLKLETEEIIDMFNSYGINPDRHEVERAIRNVKLGKYSSLIAPSEESGFLPLILSDKSENLYFQKYHAGKENLDRNLCELIGNQSSVPEYEKIKKAMETVYGQNSQITDTANSKSILYQKLAVGLCLLQNFVIISGGPGSGKTHLIFNVLRCLVGMGFPSERIWLTAPTGRAAKRMSDAIVVALANLKDKSPEDELLCDIRPHTLHRLLRFSPARNDFTYNADNLLPADVVIVDEVSMADVVMMSCLVEALPKSAKLILLGDPDQLPSVEAGAVLARFIPDTRATKVSPRIATDIQQYFGESERHVLEENVQPDTSAKLMSSTDHLVFLQGSRRSSSDIMDIARKIKDKDSGVTSLFKALSADDQWDAITKQGTPEEFSGVYHINYSDKTSAGKTREYIHDENLRNLLKRYILTYIYGANTKQQKALLGIIDEQYDETVPEESKVGEIYSRMNRSRILTLTRTGECGCVAINDYLQRIVPQELARKSNLRRERTASVYAGLPIIITQNDYQRELFNGDIGIVLHGMGGGLRAYFPVSGTFVSYPLSQLPHYETAYAVTVHKSQGSEYDLVLLIMPPEKDCPLLSTEILYTGLTRARKAAVIYGSTEIIKHAIGTETKRYSGPGFWES